MKSVYATCILLLIGLVTLKSQSISGTILTDTTAMGLPGQPVLEVMLTATGVSSVMNQADGTYTFPALTNGQDYEITPFKNDDPTLGLSVLDLLLIQSHIDDVELIDSPRKKIAADANADQCIDEADVNVLRDLLLGEVDTFPNNTSWRFIPANTFLQLDEPCPYPSFPESIFVENLNGDVQEQDFVGIKIGDVSQTTVGNGNNIPTFTIPDATGQCGNFVTVDIVVDSFSEVRGFQNSIKWNEGELQFVDILNFNLPGFDNQNVGLRDTSAGIISIVWIDPAEENNLPDTSFTICSILFECISAGGGLNSDIVLADVPTPRQIIGQDDNSLSIIDGLYNDALFFNTTPSGNILPGSPVVDQCNQTFDFMTIVDVSGNGIEVVIILNQDTIFSDIDPPQPIVLEDWPVNPGSNILEIAAADLIGGCIPISNELLIFDVAEPLIVNINSTNVSAPSANDGTISIETSGGTEPISIQWLPFVSDSSIATDLSPGIYEVFVVDANFCADLFEVPICGLFTETLASEISCPGANDGQIVATSLGGLGAVDFLWSTGSDSTVIDDLTSGEYILMSTDSIGCIDTDTITLNEPDSLLLQEVLIINDTAGLMTGSIDISISGGTMPYFYNWSNNTNSEDLEQLSAGTYSATIVDSLGCEINIGPFIVDDIVSTQNIVNFEKVQVYPNPSNGRLNLEITMTKRSVVDIQVLNPLGQILLQSEEAGREINTTLDLQDFAKGLYFVQLRIDEKTMLKKVLRH